MHRSIHKKYSVKSTVLMFLLVCVIIFPFYIMFIGAFKTNLALVKVPIDLNPFSNLTLKNIQKVLEESQVFLWLKNSILISLSVAFSTMFVGLCAGYSFSRINFRGKKFFFSLVMATMMMPKQMLMIPNYLVAKNLNLQDTMIGVILTSIAPAFAVFLCRQTISSIPGELFDAAEIDGCGEVRKFLSVVVPLSLPSLGTVSILSFFTTFNDYIWQLIMISDKKLKTLPVGLSYFAQIQGNNKGAQLAMALISTVPLTIIFILCQNFFIKGATDGAVKG